MSPLKFHESKYTNDAQPHFGTDQTLNDEKVPRGLCTVWHVAPLSNEEARRVSQFQLSILNQVTPANSTVQKIQDVNPETILTSPSVTRRHKRDITKEAPVKAKPAKAIITQEALTSPSVTRRDWNRGLDQPADLNVVRARFRGENRLATIVPGTKEAEEAAKAVAEAATARAEVKKAMAWNKLLN